MSKQWNQMPSKETTLLKVMSEELSKRLNDYEDFVWVDIPEAVHNVRNAGNLEVKTEEQSASDLQNVVQSMASNRSSDFQNIVQFMTHTVLKEEYSDLSDYDDDLISEKEEIMEKQYVKHIRNKVAIEPKLRTKMRGYSLDSEKRQLSKHDKDKFNSKKQVNQLLPKMKFDASTTAILEMSINNRYLGQYNELVGRGKNSVVFHATCHRRNCITMPYQNAVKIYKISKDEEKNKVIYRKVQREFEHLSILNRFTKEFYAPVPSAVRAWKNVIVMSFIGFNNQMVTDPCIQDAPCEKDEDLYNKIVTFLDKLYNIKHLVHGKLSARNILSGWKWEAPYIIGWSHSVKRDHPLALTKLIKDCHFVTEFYNARGVNVLPLPDLFQKITMQKPTEKLLEVIYGKDLYKLDTNPNRHERWVKQTTMRNRFKNN